MILFLFLLGNKDKYYIPSGCHFKILNPRFDHSSNSTILARSKKSLSGG